MKLRKIAAVLLAVLLVLGAMPVYAAEPAAEAGIMPLAGDVVASGECGDQGDNVTWTLTSDGTLTISGKGKMGDWEAYTQPWSHWTLKIDYAVIQSGVTSIGDYAFRDCDHLEYVRIPDSVTSIGYEAFDGCTSLTSVTIPDSVTSIGDWAFAVCYSLTSVTIPDSVTSIGDSAFYKCESLTSLTIPDSVTSIGMGAFEYCYSLTSVIIPDSVISIGESAFYDCKSLTSVTIPDSVTSIGESTFEHCESLTNVMIPNSVISIGDWAFGSCTSFTSVTIPDSVTSIGEGAFESCTSLTSVMIPDSVTSIGGYAFASCHSLTSVTIPDSVLYIGDGVFSRCDSLTSMMIPDSVTSIGYEAFDGCTSLTSVTIPDSVISIGGWAFGSCTSLTSVTIPDSVISIGGWAFGSCTSLTSVTIPDSVTSIGLRAFDSCTSLTSVTIPASVTTIEVYAFDDCDNLTINCAQGSYAEQYAEEHGIPTKIIKTLGEVKQGLLKAVDTAKNTITVYSSSTETNTLYSTSAEIASSMSELLQDSNIKDKTIVFSVAENQVERALSIFQVFRVYIQPLNQSAITKSPLTYSDDKYNMSKLELRVRFQMKPSSGFTEDELKASGVYTLALNKLTLTSNSEYLYLDTGWFDSKKNSKEIDWRGTNLIFPESYQTEETFTIFVAEDKVPANVNTQAHISLKLTYEGDESPLGDDSCEVTIPIMNKDLQKAQAEARKTGRASTKNNEKLRQALTGVTLVLDSEIDYIFTESAVSEVKQLLAIYLSEVVAGAKVESTDFYSKLTKKVQEELESKIEKGLGIEDTNWSLTGTVYLCRPVFKVKGYTIKCEINLQLYSLKDHLFGGLTPCGFDYYIYKDDELVRKGKGNYTFADIDSFCDIIMDVTKEWYKEVEGKNIDGIVADYISEKIVQEPLRTFAYALTEKWKLSDGIFNLMKGPTQNYIKRIKAQCPVDVYVYDMDGNLCASIIDNAVSTDVADVFCTVDGDAKYVYLIADDYTVKLVGTDTGTMTYTVEEYSGDELTRTVVQRDVPLTDGKTYYGLVPDIPYVNQAVYALTDGSTVLPIDEDSYHQPQEDEDIDLPTEDNPETPAPSPTSRPTFPSGAITPTGTARPYPTWTPGTPNSGTGQTASGNPLDTPTGPENAGVTAGLIVFTGAVLGAAALYRKKRR